MYLRFVAVLAFVGLISGFAPPEAHATPITIASATGGTSTATVFFWGQDFTTIAGGPWDDITFNFYSGPGATNPEAVGTAFLLNQEYLGTPASLSTATPGFLASTSTISGGAYVFASSVVLQPLTHYWLYGNAIFSLTGGPGNSGVVYVSTGGNFTSAPDSANYRVAGDIASSVPEPATLLLLGTGLAGIVRLRRKRTKTT
jgi:hypothetical protein